MDKIYKVLLTMGWPVLLVYIVYPHKTVIAVAIAMMAVMATWSTIRLASAVKELVSHQSEEG